MGEGIAPCKCAAQRADGYLVGVVLQQGVLLGVLGFIPGLGMALSGVFLGMQGQKWAGVQNSTT